MGVTGSAVKLLNQLLEPLKMPSVAFLETGAAGRRRDAKSAETLEIDSAWCDPYNGQHMAIRIPMQTHDPEHCR